MKFNREKVTKYFLISIISFFGFLILLELLVAFEVSKKNNWFTEYQYKSYGTQPYGSKVLYEQLPSLLERKVVKTASAYQVYDYVKVTSMDTAKLGLVDSLNHLILDVDHYSNFNTNIDVDFILDFVEKGNIAILSYAALTPFIEKDLNNNQDDFSSFEEYDEDQYDEYSEEITYEEEVDEKEKDPRAKEDVFYFDERDNSRFGFLNIYKNDWKIRRDSIFKKLVLSKGHKKKKSEDSKKYYDDVHEITSNLEEYYLEDPKDPIVSNLLMNLRSKYGKEFKFLTDGYVLYFEKLPKDHSKTILSVVSDSGKELPIFIEVKRGKGKLYYCTEPRLFSNFGLLYQEGVSDFVEQFFAEIESIQGQAYFVNRSNQMRTYNNSDKDADTDFSVFLSYKELRWTFYLVLICSCVFLLFGFKRRQRLIPIVKLKENTTIAFVKSISDIYYNGKHYDNIIQKQGQYFLERCRIEFRIPTDKLDKNFCHLLSQKTGVELELIAKIIKKIKQNKKRYINNQHELLTFHKLINQFNKALEK